MQVREKGRVIERTAIEEELEIKVMLKSHVHINIKLLNTWPIMKVKYRNGHDKQL